MIEPSDKIEEATKQISIEDVIETDEDGNLIDIDKKDNDS